MHSKVAGKVGEFHWVWRVGHRAVC